jgi:hypothetical protein
MGQDFIIEWLRLQRLSGDNNFFSVKQINKAMQDYGLPFGNNISLQVNKLYAGGFLEIRLKHGKIWHTYRNRKFRLKKYYVGVVSSFSIMVCEYHSKRGGS